MILNSWTSAVLLNGIPGKKNQCRRGVRQGYPLSPLPFVLAVDLLQSILNEAMNNQLISHPLPQRNIGGFPVIKYADDTLIIMRASLPQSSSAERFTLILQSVYWSQD